MGGGEYNNLGHYLVKDSKVLKINDVPKINSNRIVEDDLVDGLSDLYTKTIKQNTEKVVSVTVNISKNPLLKALFYNNYRKMHGIPMRRKVRR